MMFLIFFSLLADQVVGTQHQRREHFKWPSPSASIQRNFEKAAITTDNGACSDIGGNVLRKGGNAIDAAIAAMFCLGVVNPQSSGIGGGFLMTHFNKAKGGCIALDARETAPVASFQTMFVNDTDAVKYGFKAVAVPGELAGYWHAFRRFGSGKISWKQLVDPSVHLARHGHPVSQYLAHVMKIKEKHFRTFPSVRHWINPVTNSTYKKGEILKLPKFASTLEKIARSSDPVQTFYHGEMARTMAKEFKEAGGLITERDFANYKVREYGEALANNHFRGNLTMCGGPPPSSFSVTQLIVSTMSKLYPEGSHHDIYQEPEVLHKYIESMKFAYAQRTLLGDHDFVKDALSRAKNLTTKEYTDWVINRMKLYAQPSEMYGGINQYHPPDHGTSHVSVLDQYGNAVSATTTINRWFGATVESSEYGIIWNNEMDDFSTPGQWNGFAFAPSESNFIAPGKRPMSSMTPMVIYDRSTKKVRMVIGGSGGPKIISATAKAVVRTVIFNDSIKKAIDAPMIHNQFTPDVTQLDDQFPQNMKEILRDKYLQKFRNTTGYEGILQGIYSGICLKHYSSADSIQACGDYRRLTEQLPIGF